MLNQKLREWYLSLAADSVWKLKELVHLDMRQKTNSFNLKLGMQHSAITNSVDMATNLSSNHCKCFIYLNEYNWRNASNPSTNTAILKFHPCQ